MSKAASIPSAVRRPLSFERGSLALFASLAVLIAGLVSLDTGLTGVGLFILGGLLGAVFYCSNMALPLPGVMRWCVVR